MDFIDNLMAKAFELLSTIPGSVVGIVALVLAVAAVLTGHAIAVVLIRRRTLHGVAVHQPA